MAVKITENRQELRNHGSGAFPCAVYKSHGRDVSFPWHWHEEFEISLVEDGQIEYMVGQDRYILGAGEGIFINSGALHSPLGQICQDSTKTDIVFSGKMIYGSFDSIFWEKYIQPLAGSRDFKALVLKDDIPWQARMLSSVRRACGAFGGGDYIREFLVKKELTDFFYEMFTHHDECIGPQDKAAKDLERIKIMLSYIHDHYSENIRVSMIARTANVCSRECLRCFRKFIHMSPIQYVLQCRINAACHRLRSGEENITQICAACGFESPGYFSKIFRRFTGMTPKEYRKHVAG